MASVLVIGELLEGTPTALTLEMATLAVELAGATGTARVLLSGASETAAAEVAAHGPDVALAAGPDPGGVSAAFTAALAAAYLAETPADLVLVGATLDGKDVGGALVGLTELPILVGATGLSQEDGVTSVEMSTFGGRLLTNSRFTDGRGIIVVQAGAGEALRAASPGSIEPLSLMVERPLPAVSVVDHVSAEAAGPSIDDARIIVGAGRGVGGPDGLALVEELATTLDAAVGATRAAVDSGWIEFSQQIGQTGKTVKPDLYLACGISGAIQHKVGVQAARTIVAINKDPDAPISEFADVLVVGDLFEIVPKLSAAIRAARAGGS